MPSPINIFVASAPDDASLLRELEQHLSVLQRAKIIDLWHEQKTGAGVEWKQEIIKHLDSAQVVLLLISSAFLSSGYYDSPEIQHALERQARGEILVIPILLRPAYWQLAPFGKLKPLPSNLQPITAWPDKHRAFSEVVKDIDNAITVFLSSSLKQIKEREGKITDKSTFFPHRPSQPILRTCPQCIAKFYPGDCAITSTIDAVVSQDIVPPEVVTEAGYSENVSFIQKNTLLKNPPYKGSREQTRARSKPIPLNGEFYAHTMACRICPYCGYRLPYNIESVDNLTIAIIGATLSGKSLYITSLLHQLKERWIKENNARIQMRCMTEELEGYYIKNYLEPLFNYKSILRPNQLTQEDLLPFIYEITILDDKDVKKKFNLLFYDGSGEDYADTSRMVQFAKHVFAASGFIFLIDPLSFQSISDQLPTHLQEQAFNNRQEELLSKTLALFERYHGRNDKKGLKFLPVAMTLSKSDLLKYTLQQDATRRVRPHRLFSNPLYSLQSDIHDLEVVNNEVKGILEKNGAYKLLSIAETLPVAKFFATSATGCNVDEHGNFPYIDPCRCLDPLLWILHTLGVLKS